MHGRYICVHVDKEHIIIMDDKERIKQLEREVNALRSALEWAIDEANGWHDECRGGGIEDAAMIEWMEYLKRHCYNPKRY